MDERSLFLSNFDNAVKKKIICDSKKVFMPNRFCSLNAHFSIFPSFRDDIESLVYMLVFFTKHGEFLNQSTHEQIKTQKMNLVIEEYFDESFPEEIITMFNYIKLLGFDEFPNYPYLISLFESYFVRNNIDKENFVFDWIKTMITNEQNQNDSPEDRVDPTERLNFSPAKGGLVEIERNRVTGNKESSFLNANLLSQFDDQNNPIDANEPIKLYPANKLVQRLKENTTTGFSKYIS